MALKTSIIYRFLNQQEAGELVALLERVGIKSFLQQMPSDMSSPGYQVSILENEIKRAMPILKQFGVKQKERIRTNKMICSKCGSSNSIILEKQKMSILKRIITIGASAIKCDNCGHEWYI